MRQPWASHTFLAWASMSPSFRTFRTAESVKVTRRMYWGMDLGVGYCAAASRPLPPFRRGHRLGGGHGCLEMLRRRKDVLDLEAPEKPFHEGRSGQGRDEGHHDEGRVDVGTDDPRREPDLGEEELHHPAGIEAHAEGEEGDRKSTRLNSSHGYISYAVFCLKKK